MPNSPRSKHSTESDTNTKKNKRLRFLLRTHADEPQGSRDIDQILDLYWGGSERRITGLTLRIIAVNAIALVILVLGVLYLGQSQNNLIEAKLATFQSEIELVSAAISQGAIEEVITPPPTILDPPGTEMRLNLNQAAKMVKRMSKTMNKRIRLFGEDGQLIADSHTLTGPGGTIQIIDLEPVDHSLDSIQILKKFTAFIIGFLPDRRILPRYPDIEITRADHNPDARDALKGNVSLSAWTDKNDRILLSAASPVFSEEKIMGSVLLTRVARDIEEGIINVWWDILRVFFGTLLITILLSIYLSGAIARPLKRLARAAEQIRSGHSTSEDIPDLSYRHDEIGELSVVLKDMTQALWQRMDSIERFAADVAHELKNPLTSLKSAVETAAIVKKKEDREKLMNIIKHDAERLDRLITDISHASRLDTELSRETYQPVSINKILYNILDVYQNPLERQKPINNGVLNVTPAQKDIKIILDIQEEAEQTMVIGIEMRLSQVFQNLLNNALSFSPEQTSIKIQAVHRLNAVVITVEDEGPGIPDSKLDTIFERFYSERPDYEDYGRHSGLGLSICKQIIEAHDGRIFAENRKDLSGKILGAKFTVILTRA